MYWSPTSIAYVDDWLEHWVVHLYSGPVSFFRSHKVGRDFTRLNKSPAKAVWIKKSLAKSPSWARSSMKKSINSATWANFSNFIQVNAMGFLFKFQHRAPLWKIATTQTDHTSCQKCRTVQRKIYTVKIDSYKL